MSRIKPLKRRCANNFCTRNAYQNGNLCQKHEQEKIRAENRKFRERKAIEDYRKLSGPALLR